MTRQNKVALVVGFALVLLVGILISDYLSEAQTRKSADLVPADRTAVAPPSSAPLIDLQSTDRPRQPDPAIGDRAAEPVTAAAPALRALGGDVAAAERRRAHAARIADIVGAASAGGDWSIGAARRRRWTRAADSW